MMLLLRLAVRNTFRNLRRTLLTAGTVLLGVAFLTVTLAWIEGIFGDMITAYTSQSGPIRVVKAEYAAREELNPLYENIPDADSVVDAIRKVPGVLGVEPRIRTGAVITASEEIGENVCMVVGASDAWYRDRLEGPKHLVEGTWFTQPTGEVVLGRLVARDIGAKVGADVLLLGQTQYGSMAPVKARLTGIISSDSTVDRQAFLSMEDARWMVDLPAGTLELLVYTGSTEQNVLGPIAVALRAVPALQGMVVQPWFERDPFASMMGLILGMKLVLQGLIVFITALAIFNTMTMSVLERTGEIGVMRAMGLGRLGAVSMFVVEAMLIGLLGGIGGALLGGAGGLYLESHGLSIDEKVGEQISGEFPMTATFYADMNPSLVLTALFLGILIATVGAFLPSLRAASISPVTAMRSRR